jgi:putative transposase
LSLELEGRRMISGATRLRVCAPHLRGSAVWAMKIAKYDTSLTDAQWALIQPLLPKAKKRGRRPTDRRPILDAILYLLKGGIPWRLLPVGFPPWQTVYDVFRKWTLTNVWEAINARLRSLVRADHGKRSRPTAAILDSQSVKSDPHGGGVGYDAAKRIKGRKRHLLVDTLGLLLGVELSAADVAERQGAQRLLGRVLRGFTWLRRLWVDGGYSGENFAQWVKGVRPLLEVEVVKRSDAVSGFEVLPRRWVVERTFGWLMRHRRLVRDYETTEESAAAWIFLAMIRIQVRRLA